MIKMNDLINIFCGILSKRVIMLKQTLSSKQICWSFLSPVYKHGLDETMTKL